MIGRTVKVRIFPYFKILNFRSDDVIFLRSVRSGHFRKRTKKNRTTTLVALTRTTLSVIANRTKIEIKEKRQRTTIAENVPSCNYCAATIVVRPLPTTVKGENQPSGLA